MKKYCIHVGVFIAILILLTGFKKNTHQQSFLSAKSMNRNSCASSLSELPEIIISDLTVIQGEKGQSPAEVMVCLSQAASEPVTVEYSTENGTAKAGVDYVSTKGSIRFEPGEIAKWITVSIIGEVAADPDEDAVHQDHQRQPDGQQPGPEMVARLRRPLGRRLGAPLPTLSLHRGRLRWRTWWAGGAPPRATRCAPPGGRCGRARTPPAGAPPAGWSGSAPGPR